MSVPVAKRIEIRRSGTLRHRWVARFIAEGNHERLAHTIQHYANLGDLTAMLTKYFPDWTVTIRERQRTTIHTMGKYSQEYLPADDA